MAVNKCASEEVITYQRAPVWLISSWRVMERNAEVLVSSIFNAVIVYQSIGITSYKDRESQ